ncbi:MAG: hypothetical protein QOE36_2658 [Gaiellaceae bacterium]|nr:hypothetical protein [Gaiellaceae bacterium]
MTRAYFWFLLALSGIWGASYLFIKVAVREIEPTAMIALRLVLASLVLLGYVVAQSGFRGGVRELRAAGRHAFFLGVVNAAIPFTLIAWAETHIDSGVAAIANASMPIFVVLLALRFRPSERVAGLRLAGVLVGLVGVGVLAGVHPRGGWWAVAGTLAVVLASVSYAAGSLYAQALVAGTRGPVLAAVSMLGATMVMIPLGLLQLPDHVPSWKALGSVAALGIGGTAFAQILLYRMLGRFGAARVSLVTYLMPVTALIYGTALLGEPLTAPALGGFALILAGVAAGSGALRFVRRRPVTQTP